MTFDEMLNIAEGMDVEVFTFHFTDSLRGLCVGQNIAITDEAQSDTERKCILAEELGHYISNAGDITSEKHLKEEKRGRRWGYEVLLPLSSLVTAARSGCQNLAEMAEYLEVTEDYLQETLMAYEEKYGLYTEFENYAVFFSPLSIAVYTYDELKAQYEYAEA